jgi:hypothetical protein
MFRAVTRLLSVSAGSPRGIVNLCEYDGPSPADGALLGQECTLKGPAGLIVEVAQSTVTESGRGLFVRVGPDEPVTVPGGTALCGYGTGEMLEERSVHAAGRCTEFRLVGCAVVWFEDELTNACELLQREDITEIAGHDAVRDASGQLLSIRVDESYTRRFFIPSEEAVDGKHLEIDSVGIMANDLAGGFADLYKRSGYDAAAAAANILVLVQGLERDESDPSRLLPSQPVPTISRTVTFANEQPMEVGISYGDGYWFGGS